jgi:hypothetical protein
MMIRAVAFLDAGKGTRYRDWPRGAITRCHYSPMQRLR